MFKKIVLLMIMLSAAFPVYAQSYPKNISTFCSTLINKDIISVHTRPLLKSFFYTENDLSDFIVHMNIKMMRAGIKGSTVYGCKPEKVKVNGSKVYAVFYITGKGVLPLLKRHLLISTNWIKKDKQWYLINIGTSLP